MFSMHVTCDMHTTLYSQYCDMHVSLNMHESRMQYAHYMQEISTREYYGGPVGHLQFMILRLMSYCPMVLLSYVLWSWSLMSYDHMSYGLVSYGLLLSYVLWS